MSTNLLPFNLEASRDMPYGSCFTTVVFNIRSCDDLEEDIAGLLTKLTDGQRKKGTVDRFDGRIRIQIVLTDHMVRSETAIYNLRVIESAFNIKKSRPC